MMKMASDKPQGNNPNAKAQKDKAKVAVTCSRDADFTTLSGASVDAIYTPADTADLDYAKDRGAPGEYPYTRGPYTNMYRGRLRTMRQF
jgi:methylmalonyl-CoA mutase N-terminal domain/subunit